MQAAPRWKDIFDAAENNDVDAVKYYIEKVGVPIKSTNSRGETAAFIATKKGNLIILEYLLTRDISLISIVDKSGQQILHVAIKEDFLDIVRFLIDTIKMDITQDYNFYRGNTAVHTAAKNGRLNILKYFIEEKHIQVNILNEFGEPPAFVAAASKRLDIVKYLVEEQKADVMMLDYKYSNILFASAKHGDTTTPRYLLDKKRFQFDIDWKDNEGRTVTHWAAKKNYLKLLTYFVEVKHSDVNMFDNMKMTPMHLAAEEGNIKIVEYLYENKADPELEDMYGRKPIQVAKNDKIIQFLTDMADKKRERRSISDLFIFPSVQGPTPVASKLFEGITVSPATSRRLLDNGYNRVIHNNTSNFINFLAFVEAWLKYSKGSGYRQEVKHEALLSPEEIIENRIDPIAVDTINY